MEDVLDLYEAPYDPAYPVVCFDESPKQLVGKLKNRRAIGLERQSRRYTSLDIPFSERMILGVAPI